MHHCEELYSYPLMFYCTVLDLNRIKLHFFFKYFAIILDQNLRWFRITFEIQDCNTVMYQLRGNCVPKVFFYTFGLTAFIFNQIYTVYWNLSENKLFTQVQAKKHLTCLSNKVNIFWKLTCLSIDIKRHSQWTIRSHVSWNRGGKWQTILVR
jgi:hypothetical protein